MDEHNIKAFINHFHTSSKNENITEVFTSGCCYWFAYILCARFPELKIMYDPTVNHFMAGYKGRLFDITGEVTEKYIDNAVSWKDFDDLSNRVRLVRQCVNFEE